MHFLSRHKTKIAFLLAGILFVTLIAFAVYKREHREERSVSGNLATVAGEIVVESDSDLDGLKDWEEVLWGTNPTKEDSDADGTLDGDEVEQNRNPKKTGPNDKLESASSSVAVLQTENNLTADASIEFFQKYLAFKKAGTPVGAEEEEALALSVVSNLEAPDPPKSYTIIELNVLESDDPILIRNFGTKMGEVIIEKGGRGLEYELRIVAEALQSENYDSLTKLHNNAAAYRATLQAFLFIPAPRSSATLLLDLVNNYEAMSHYVEDMVKLPIDPVTAIHAFAEYQKTADRLNQSFLAFKRYFTAKGIVYPETDTGALFVALGQE